VAFDQTEPLLADPGIIAVYGGQRACGASSALRGRLQVVRETGMDLVC